MNIFRKYFIGSLFGFLVLTITIFINYKNESTFNKPTLIRVFYDGDFNGTGVDFKKDGTYIFDNSAIGISNYTYGKYTINKNKILLDKSEIENVIKSNSLEILKRNETDYYLFQIDSNSNIIKNSTEFRVVIDNRKK